MSCPEAILVDEVTREMNWLPIKGHIMPVTRHKRGPDVFESEEYCSTEKRMREMDYAFQIIWLL